MFLKNEIYLIFFYTFIFLIFSNNTYSNIDNKSKVLEYLSSLEYFSASFIQNDGQNISEGKVYIGKNRVRAEYFLPTKILIILDKNKAMYYNYDLEEDEFFNPKNTDAWFWYDIFRNPNFFEDSVIKMKDNELVLEKIVVNIDERNYSIKVVFEDNPLVLRSVHVSINDDFIELSIHNHTYNENFNKDFFKLINPSFLN